ncbi:AAA family ATPase [Desulfosarcina variabilis]|uniref:AAA family ATPase n=1 Tax=Desulfosarcina variabilis TaxID=2300 RepID=UPI003AFB4451
MKNTIAKNMQMFQRVPEAPTNPKQPQKTKNRFDIGDLYDDGVGAGETTQTGLDEKLRQAYFWITNTAIISPFYDIEYNDQAPSSFTFGDSNARVTLPTGQSYSSFVLLPLLNLAVRRRCLIVGGPGRGKTATAILMGLIAGYDLTDVKRAIQHGQPQMTIADLLGHPLPADMVKAESTRDIRIAWRRWLEMRVKIIDEYNRIPTRTQSALLTVLADNYAEILDQVYECPESAWFLTANDDGGGGTYQVIEALRDRIDIVIRALHFNTRFLGDLQRRIEHRFRPERMVPEEIIFTDEEISAVQRRILDIELPRPVRSRLEFFCRHFEFFEPASTTLEYMTKDTAKLSGLDFRNLARQETGKDRVRDLGTQTRNGLSVRKLMTVLVFSKALAYFRGAPLVELEDVRQILPFVLHDTLSPHLESEFFDQPGCGAFRVDRISWLRHLFDLSCGEYERLNLDEADPLAPFDSDFEKGLDGLAAGEVEQKMVRIEAILNEWAGSGKLYGHMADDILKLKYYHQRYANYHRWLLWKS